MDKISLIREMAEKAMNGETVRMHYLIARGEKLLAGIIIVTGFQMLDVPNLLASGSPSVKVLCFLSLAVLGLSLFFGFACIGIKDHSGYPREDKLLENLKPENVSDEAAEQAIIQLLLKARERNAKLNDTRIKLLSPCGWLFLTGFLLVSGSQLLAASFSL